MYYPRLYTHTHTQTHNYILCITLNIHTEFWILSHPIWDISLIYGPINMEYVMWFYLIYMELTTFMLEILYHQWPLVTFGDLLWPFVAFYGLPWPLMLLNISPGYHNVSFHIQKFIWCVGISYMHSCAKIS